MKRLICLLLCAMMLCGFALADKSGQSILMELDNIQFMFTSGVGGWYTQLLIHANGTFDVYFKDTELGDSGEGYPNGTEYFCGAHGTIADAVYVDDNTYKLYIESLTVDEEQQPRDFTEGVRYVMQDVPYGLENADHLMVYLPGTPTQELPPAFVGWTYMILADGYDRDLLPFYGLYNEAEECGFFDMDWPYEGVDAGV